MKSFYFNELVFHVKIKMWFNELALPGICLDFKKILLGHLKIPIFPKQFLCVAFLYNLSL